MNDIQHKSLISELLKLPKFIGKPKAIEVISAHLEEEKVTLLKTKSPPMPFDYGGFPDEIYEYKYPAPLAEDVNKRIEELFQEAKVELSFDYKRGYDHEVLVHLLQIYPDADIPIIQISLCSSLDPEENYRIREILSPLTNEGVFNLGSGMTFHNMNAFFNPTKEVMIANEIFTSFLVDIITNQEYSQDERKSKLINVNKAPGKNFRLCHPREEHLIPLMVVAGAAN